MIEEFNKIYKDDINNINNFLSSRPDLLGCYCYAIGDYFEKKNYKLVLVTDDIWKWQENNIHDNEFSMYSNMLYRNGYNYIDYIGIKDNKNIFDYTLMSFSEFVNNVFYWNNITHAEIFQRPFISVKSVSELDNIIKKNQQNFLVLSILCMNNLKDLNFFDVMTNMYCMTSYLSNDILSLVDEDYEILKKIYEKYDFISFKDDFNISIDFDKINDLLIYLPTKIKDIINDRSNYEIKYILKDYFRIMKFDGMDKIDYERFLVNGFFKSFLYNGRSIKVKSLKK